MISATTLSQRLLTLQQHIPDSEIWLFCNPADIAYLTGFICLVPEEREAFLLMRNDHILLAHASFSPPPPKLAELHNVTSVTPTALVKHLKESARAIPHPVLKADISNLHADEYQALQTAGYQPLSLNRHIIWQQRMIKDTEEQLLLAKAGQVANRAFQQLLNEMKVGQTENEITRRLEVLLLEQGSERPAFPTIVAFGDHGALPHHQSTDRQLNHNTPVLIDFGATVDGYRSDMTRSWWFGDQPDSEFLQIEKIVTESYRHALEVASIPSATVADVDLAARQHIAHASYEHNFIHTTGHGVGLEIHEPPSVYHTQSQLLAPGMVITIEPGIYLEGKFGFRYENTVLIGASATTELTGKSSVQ